MKVTEAPRVAYTVEEFAALFGHHYMWAYRLVTKGKVRVIKGYGKSMIPASEVERILSEGGGQ